jgi:hypothetical protein
MEVLMRPALIALVFLCAPAAAETWVDRAPVISARPVYATSPRCHPEAARRLGQADLVESLREDLERARCEADGREISGWHVVYRYAGREYDRIMPRHPGRFIDVEVEIQPGARDHG